MVSNLEAPPFLFVDLGFLNSACASGSVSGVSKRTRYDEGTCRLMPGVALGNLLTGT